MYSKIILSNIHADSFLIGILHLIGLLSWYHDIDKRRGRPFVYPTTVILRCYLVRIWMRIPSNNCLHQYFGTSMPYNRKVMEACGLNTLPDRRTFDRRFKVLPIDMLIGIMGRRFVAQGLADCTIIAVDSTMIRTRGAKVWHKSHIKSNTIPRSGIDTDARWGFSATKGWLYGYKLHICCTTGSLVVPLSAAVTSANVYDNQLYHNGCIETIHNKKEILHILWQLYASTRHNSSFVMVS